jgi:hypothetical protein
LADDRDFAHPGPQTKPEASRQEKEYLLGILDQLGNRAGSKQCYPPPGASAIAQPNWVAGGDRLGVL